MVIVLWHNLRGVCREREQEGGKLKNEAKCAELKRCYNAARGRVLGFLSLESDDMASLARLPPRIVLPSFIACSKPNTFAPFVQLPTRRNLTTKRDFYLNGRWTPPITARDFHVTLFFPPNFQTRCCHSLHWQVIDPSTEEACAVISLGSDADADAAVAAAKAALPSWSSRAPAERRAYIEALLAQYSARSLPDPPFPTQHKTSNQTHAQIRRDGPGNQHRTGRPHRLCARQPSAVPAMAHARLFESIRQHAVAASARPSRAK